MDSGVPPGELLPSPTERLLGCQQRLLQLPLTAPGLGCGVAGAEAGLQRPATGSPGKVKSLMQVGGWAAADTFVAGQLQVCRGKDVDAAVPARTARVWWFADSNGHEPLSKHCARPAKQVKGEQDAALQQLRERPRPFRASPLPLSTMQPRYQQQEEQREARRQAAHEQRRQQLLEQQRPFGFEERAAERAQRRLLLHGGGPGSPLAAAASGRPGTPPFHAQPVPVATTEVRCHRRIWFAQNSQLDPVAARHTACKAGGFIATVTVSPRRPATPCWLLSSSCSTAAAQQRLPKQHRHTLPAAALLPPTAAPQLRQLAGGRQSGQARPRGRGFQPQQM